MNRITFIAWAAMGIFAQGAFADDSSKVPHDAVFLAALAVDGYASTMKLDIERLKSAASNYYKQNNLSLRCDSVYYVWSNQDLGSTDVIGKLGDVGNFLTLGIFRSGWMHDESSDDDKLFVNVLCEERPFSEKTIISAEQSCEQSPQPECLSQAYQDQFKTIKQTTQTDIGLDGI